jgi:hypothetical protein
MKKYHFDGLKNKKPTRDIKPLGGPNYEKQTKQASQIYTIFN